MSIPRITLEDQLYFIAQEYEQSRNYDLFKPMEEAFEEYLRENFHDSEVWMRYALFFNMSNVEYPDKAVEILEQLVLRDRKNARALLLLADVQSSYVGRVTEQVADYLCNFQTDNPEERSMIEYARGRFGFYYTDEKKYAEYLLKSIELCPRYANNYEELGRLFIERKNLQRGCELLKKAIRNTLLVYPNPVLYMEPRFNIPTADEYIGIFITGTLKAQTIFEDLCNTYAFYSGVKSAKVPYFHEK